MIKLLKAVLAGCASWLAMTAHAHADPIFTPLTYLLFAGPLGAVFTPGIIYAGLQIAAYGAVLGAQLALSQRQQPKIDPGELKNTFQEAETSEYNAIGRVRLGGLKAFGNTKDQFISRLIWHCKGPIDGVEEFFAGGRSITVDPGGAVSSPPWARSNGTYLTIQTKIGDGTETAWPQLITDFPTLWTSAHRCRGIFQSLARFRVPSIDSESSQKLFQKLYQGGAPDIMVTARVGLVYDPRDPSQDVNDDPQNPATWKWTDNGILCAAHIMRRYPDLRSTDFDWDFIAAEADKADALVPTLSGTEPRARCWGVWPSETQRGETMQQVLDSIGAEVVMSDTGLIRIHLIDDEPEPEITFTSKHITELNWKSGPEAVERPNVCRIKYYSPERGYDMGEINMSGIAWARVQDEIDRYGEKYFDVELPFCPSASQAQRIARRLFLQARADAGSIRTNMAGLAAWGVSYANVVDDDAEETMLCRFAPPRIDDEQGQVDIPYIVWPPALISQPWNPATMEAPPPEPAPELQYETDIPTPAPPPEAAIVQYPDGTWETRIRIAGADDVDLAEGNYRYYPDETPTLWASMTEYAAGSSYYAYAAVNTNGLKAEFRARFADGDEVGYFSDPLIVDPMIVSNAAPPAPTLDVNAEHVDGSSTWQFHVSATSFAMNVARITVTGGSADPVNIDQNARPGQTVTVDTEESQGSGDRTITFTARAYTTNGTASPPATFNYTIPGSG